VQLDSLSPTGTQLEPSEIKCISTHGHVIELSALHRNTLAFEAQP
jgi:hypothetical protein